MATQIARLMKKMNGNKKSAPSAVNRDLSNS
jgi:hypothetical protein